MRNFSEKEKNILKNLINSNTLKTEGMIMFDVFLENHFFGDEHSSNIYVDSKAQEVYLSIKSDDKIEHRKEVIKVIVLVNLLTYLVHLGIISFIGEEKEIEKTSGQQYSSAPVRIEKPTSSFLLEKIGKFILPSEELKQLVDNNFKSSEEIRHRQTMILAVIAIAISLLIGLLGLYLSN